MVDFRVQGSVMARAQGLEGSPLGADQVSAMGVSFKGPLREVTLAAGNAGASRRAS
jgi:hypothetical protein